MNEAKVEPAAQQKDDSIVGQVNEIRDQISDGYQEIEETYLTTRDQVYEFNRTAVAFIREHPAACIAGGFAVGYIIGKLANRRWFI